MWKKLYCDIKDSIWPLPKYKANRAIVLFAFWLQFNVTVFYIKVCFIRHLLYLNILTGVEDLFKGYKEDVRS